MDNILEYIVFIFFLISLLNGIFGKKKKKQQQQQKTNSTRVAEPQAKPAARTQPKKETAELLEELFGLKLPKEEPAVKQQKANQFTVSEPVAKPVEQEVTWNPEAEFENTYTEQTYKQEFKEQTYRKPEKMDKLAPRIRASEKYHEFEKPVEVKTNKRRNEIKAKLKNPSTIRDYIIVQELLNEPKAFRI